MRKKELRLWKDLVPVFMSIPTLEKVDRIRRKGCRIVPEWLGNRCRKATEWLCNGCEMVAKRLWNGCGMVVEWLRNGCGMVAE